jgi:hypothetical protein
MRDQDGPSPRRHGIRLYDQPHRFYAGVDLHARILYVHVLDLQGQTVFEHDLPAQPNAFLQAVQPFRSGLVVGAECMFAWYWLADLCSFFVRQRALWNAWRAPLGAHTQLFLGCLVL